MADLKISELTALAGANLSAGDLLPVVDISASETKRITIQDTIGYGVTLIADATIPGAKILFNAGTIDGDRLSSVSVGTAQIADDSITAAKLANESTVDLVTTLPANGAFTGQFALDLDDLKIYCWDGSTWQNIKAAGSINTVVGTTAGLINIAIATSGDQVTVSSSFDATGAASQFLAGPTSAAGAVSYRTIDPVDLPTATTSAKGAVQVNGEGLRMDGTVIEIDNDLTARATPSLVTYGAKGLITSGRAIEGSDLPLATGGGVGAIQPGTGLSVTGGGVLNHTNIVTGATATKITYDAQGHVTAGTTLVEADIPNLAASKITSGTLNISLIGTKAITGVKLADASTVKFGGAVSTEGVVTFPAPEFQGQYFFDALNGDLYLYDGSAWQPITITAGELIYGGTYNANLNQVKTVTAAGSAAGLAINAALPSASTSNLRYYVVVSDSGTGTAPAPTVALAPPDMLVSSGTTWDLIDVSSAIAGQIASNISFMPYGNIAATNVQTALQELEDEKLAKAGGTVTGELLIGTAGTLVFEGSTADAYETTIAVTDPTSDHTITLPNATGTVVLSGAIVNADINASAAIADTKLGTISTAGKVNGTALTGTIPGTVLGNSTVHVGTTAIALNRASANDALTGILSVALPGATSGTITVSPAAVAGTTSITIPATTGTLITTGDTSSVTNTMLAGSIADSKLSTITTAGKVSGSAITSGTIGGTTVFSTSGAFSTTGTVAVGQASAAANTELDLAGTYAQTVVAVGALNIDCSTGNYFTKTINGASTFTVSNIPSSRSYSFTLELTHTSGAITWFSGVEWPGGTAPTLTTGKTHLFMFITDDGGTRWRASSLINYTN